MSKARTAILNVVGLTPRVLASGATPRLAQFAAQQGSATVHPMLPAVTSSVQATYLTGTPPSAHGIVANGWYDRELAEHHFWKQSDRLMHGDKLWETARRSRPGFTCAKLFWWNNMYSTADWSITPRPLYLSDGRKVFDVHSHPLAIRDQIKRDLGPFPFPSFWGPMAGLPSSDWIARSAEWIERHHHPDLSLVYLPHLDYNLQRLGPEDPKLAEDFRAIDAIVGRLLDGYAKQQVRCVILSEYGITRVNRAVALNRQFRRRGWLTIKDELGHETLDLGTSRAFAIADHQIAHVYVNDPSLHRLVREELERTDGVAAVLDSAGKFEAGLDHPRSGDLVALAQEDAWFSYYYWDDDAKAPDFARCIDIHRKYGYDPVELFFDPKKALPKLRAAGKLLQKTLGFRMLMDLIPLDASLVRGSHGVVPADARDWPVLLGVGAQPAPLPATDVHAKLVSLLQ